MRVTKHKAENILNDIAELNNYMKERAISYASANNRRKKWFSHCAATISYISSEKTFIELRQNATFDEEACVVAIPNEHLYTDIDTWNGILTKLENEANEIN